MNKTEEKLREEKIDQEILFDCYSTEEQIRAWYDYLIESISFPFDAVWQNEKITVLDMSDFYQCEKERDMLVETNCDGEIQSISLFHINDPNADEKTKEALNEWKHWVNSGNRFDDEDGFY